MARVGQFSFDLKVHGSDGVILESKTIDILVAVEEHRSITAASKAIGISYRTAWLTIDRANIGYGNKLVRTAVGGNTGGNAFLTEFGRRVVNDYLNLQDALIRTVVNESETSLKVAGERS